MKEWNEFHIGLVYYSALAISFLVGILTVFYLRPTQRTLVKISGKTGMFWNRSFISMLLMAGVLGAMSVSFETCDRDYTEMLNNPVKTLDYGSSIVTMGCIALAFISLVWYVIFATLRLSRAWRIRPGPVMRIFLAFGIILFVVGLSDRMVASLIKFLDPF